jgi:SAM-dependent methyltransferase
MGNTNEQNMEHNRLHYDKKYQNVNVNSILRILNNLDNYLKHTTTTHISWLGLYVDDFKDKVKGKDVLELGCGNCTNVAVLAALGAKVVANDISDESGNIIASLNEKYPFNYPIRFVGGNFLESDITDRTFDFVVGKAFLHHLTLDLEYQILKKVANVLKVDGEARFFETAVNSKILDEIRWGIPMGDRPSKWFQPQAFVKWEASDPHPPRDNSSSHYKKVGYDFFDLVIIKPLGILERFNRILPINRIKKANFKRTALKMECYLPMSLRSYGARSQVIIYRNPK